MRIMINFTPGPSQIYFTVPDHLRSAVNEGILSLSHRSKRFEKIVIGVNSGLRELLNIPDDFSIFFAASATEIWERSIQNLVQNHSLHFVNGAFSKRFYEIAAQLGKSAEKIELTSGQGFGFAHIQKSKAELIALTHNETSSGVTLTKDFISQIRDQNSDALIIVDAVSSTPYPNFDFTKMDSLFFSIQKGFGLPAGLGVWIVNNRCIEKASELASHGIHIGTYHSIPVLLQNAKKNQTPETPNVLGIYLLEKVIGDMLRRGIGIIRKETEYKAAVLYQCLNDHPLLSPWVRDPAVQSQTVIVADTGVHTVDLTNYLLQHGFSAGEGYGEGKMSQLRFANFPAHSKEQFEKLADLISAYR